jgi:hypothetical protein
MGKMIDGFNSRVRRVPGGLIVTEKVRFNESHYFDNDDVLLVANCSSVFVPVSDDWFTDQIESSEGVACASDIETAD